MKRETPKPAPARRIFELRVRDAEGRGVAVTAESLALAVRQLEREGKGK